MKMRDLIRSGNISILSLYNVENEKIYCYNIAVAFIIFSSRLTTIIVLSLRDFLSSQLLISFFTLAYEISLFSSTAPTYFFRELFFILPIFPPLAVLEITLCIHPVYIRLCLLVYGAGVELLRRGWRDKPRKGDRP